MSSSGVGKQPKNKKTIQYRDKTTLQKLPLLLFPPPYTQRKKATEKATNIPSRYRKVFWTAHIHIDGSHITANGLSSKECLSGACRSHLEYDWLISVGGEHVGNSTLHTRHDKVDSPRFFVFNPLTLCDAFVDNLLRVYDIGSILLKYEKREVFHVSIIEGKKQREHDIHNETFGLKQREAYLGGENAAWKGANSNLFMKRVDRKKKEAEGKAAVGMRFENEPPERNNRRTKPIKSEYLPWEP